MTALLFTTEPTVAPVKRFISVAEAVTEAIPEAGSPVQFVRTPEAGVPSAGVTNVGLVANTSAPEPVSPVTAEAKLVLEGVARKVATLAARPLMPVETGRPVQLVKTPLAGVPRAGVTKVGLVANTKAPLPVSSVTAVARFAEEGVARKVATPVPRPLTPVETGRPVQLVSVPEVGVPRTGVTNVGLVRSALVPTAVWIAENSASNSVPLITFAGFPEESASLAVKLVVGV